MRGKKSSLLAVNLLCLASPAVTAQVGARAQAASDLSRSPLISHFQKSRDAELARPPVTGISGGPSATVTTRLFQGSTELRCSVFVFAGLNDVDIFLKREPSTYQSGFSARLRPDGQVKGSAQHYGWRAGISNKIVVEVWGFQHATASKAKVKTAPAGLTDDDLDKKLIAIRAELMRRAATFSGNH